MSQSSDAAGGEPVSGLPLPDPLVRLLEAVRPPRLPPGRPRMNSGPRPRALRDFTPVPEDEARAAVGADLPALPSLSAAGFSRHCAFPRAGGMFDAQSLRDGDGACVYVFYLPQAAGWNGDQPLVEAPVRGATFLRVHSVLAPVQQEEVGVLHVDPLDGDSTVLRVGGVLVGVHHLSGGTRLSWVAEVAGREWGMTLWNAGSPRSTVELLVSDLDGMRLSLPG